MAKRKIIGIVLVKNEDLYIERVLTNIREFCDEIILADNGSKDKTAERVQYLRTKKFPIAYYSIRHPSASHDLISGYGGENVWIFAVDGDEIYDPVGLQALRLRILSGEYDEQWMILGNVLNCVKISLEDGRASGYLAPPCRSMTKLYNFNAISSWNGPCPERLHGGTIQFRDGFDRSRRLELYKNVSWENSWFRCLHLCFVVRSSLEKDPDGNLVIRRNISDNASGNMASRLLARGFGILGINRKSEWKREKYMRGELVEVNAESFLLS